MSNNHQIISVRVIPGSKTQQIIGFMENGTLKIKIKAKPIEGKANKELIKALAELLSVKESSIEIISGQSSRNKHIRISNIEKEVLLKKIDNTLLQEP